MAEKETKNPKQEKQIKSEKHEKKEEKKVLDKRKSIVDERAESIIRILGYDIPGSRNIYAGLTKIKGVSWAISNALCIRLNYVRTKKISDLTKEEIVKIEQFLKNMNIPDYLKNRRIDRETGETSHHFGSDLDMKREFDIKRMKQIKCYKGIRHALGQPVRGQKTRSHSRKTGRIVGVSKRADAKKK